MSGFRDDNKILETLNFFNKICNLVSWLFQIYDSVGNTGIYYTEFSQKQQPKYKPWNIT